MQKKIFKTAFNKDYSCSKEGYSVESSKRSATQVLGTTQNISIKEKT